VTVKSVSVTVTVVDVVVGIVVVPRSNVVVTTASTVANSPIVLVSVIVVVEGEIWRYDEQKSSGLFASMISRISG